MGIFWSIQRVIFIQTRCNEWPKLKCINLIYQHLFLFDQKKNIFLCLVKNFSTSWILGGKKFGQRILEFFGMIQTHDRSWWATFRLESENKWAWQGPFIKVGWLWLGPLGFLSPGLSGLGFSPYFIKTYSVDPKKAKVTYNIKY